MAHSNRASQPDSTRGPAAPLLAKLLANPQEQGIGTLILVNEVLMYMREKAGLSQGWRERIVDFFQHLVQAVTKVDRASLVEVRRTRRLAEGVSATGARVHSLPDSPRDLADNGEFRYAVLGPEAASDSGPALPLLTTRPAMAPR